jgi:hypothetical protein
MSVTIDPPSHHLAQASSASHTNVVAPASSTTVAPHKHQTSNIKQPGSSLVESIFAERSTSGNKKVV